MLVQLIPDQGVSCRFYSPNNSLGMRGICKKYWDGRYYATFRRRVLDEVKGCGVASGGKGRGKGMASTGKLNH